MIVDPVITVYFDLSAQGGDFFTVEHPTLGALDTGGPLAGDVAVEVTGRGYGVNINRGRNRDLDEIPAGTCRVHFRNDDRAFDPSYAAGVYFPNVAPGKRITVDVYGQRIFDGTADDWETSYAPGDLTDASTLVVDALGGLARKDFDEWTTTAGQLAGERITSVLTRNEVVYAGGVDLDDGVEELQADLVTWGSNVLNYLQLVAKSDLGRLFASRSGVLTYRDRLSSTGSPRFTFADDGTGFRFSGVVKRSASELLYTRVGVDREGGILQTVTDPDAVDLYGVRALSLGGLLLSTDGQSLALAEFLLGIYKAPEDQIAALTVIVSGYQSEADQAEVTSLEIGDVVDVTWTPAGVGAPSTQTLVVEGVSHQLGVGEAHVMTVAFTAAAQTTMFILDDAVLGILSPPSNSVLAF